MHEEITALGWFKRKLNENASKNYIMGNFHESLMHVTDETKDGYQRKI